MTVELFPLPDILSANIGGNGCNISFSMFSAFNFSSSSV